MLRRCDTKCVARPKTAAMTKNRRVSPVNPFSRIEVPREQIHSEKDSKTHPVHHHTRMCKLPLYVYTFHASQPASLPSLEEPSPPMDIIKAETSRLERNHKLLSLCYATKILCDSVWHRSCCHVPVRSAENASCPLRDRPLSCCVVIKGALRAR